MAQALDDTTNAPSASGPTKNQEAHDLAREKGWVDPQPYNYEAAAAGPNATVAGDGDVSDSSVPQWAHNAARYEWLEEYGDVGPKVPELENQLFRSEFLNRHGAHLEK